MNYKHGYITILAFLNTFLFMALGIKAQIYSLYGVTANGGTYNKGVIYRYTYPSGKDTVILNFDGSNGAIPHGNFLLGNDGNLYGTTTQGGSSNYGVLYRINPRTYKDTVLTNFSGTNGSVPLGGIIQATNGLIYGLTSKGGTYGLGVCYSYNISTYTQTVLFSFDGTNGESPNGLLVQATNGLLYGHTIMGGLYGEGVMFYYNITTGQDSVIYNYSSPNGYFPRAFLQASNSLIYGTTLYGGSVNQGVLYSFDIVSKSYNLLLNFTGTNGSYPCGDTRSLFQNSNGLLYGIAQMGGAYNKGIVYSYDINTGVDSLLLNFSSFGALGKSPYLTGYAQIPGGLLIIPIDSGGANGVGTLLSYDFTSGNFKKLLDFNDTNGAYPTNDLITLINDVEEEGINNNVAEYKSSTIFPNPNNGEFSLIMENNELEQLNIYDITGKEIYQKSGRDFIHVNLDCPSPGTYLYRITSADNLKCSFGKFVVK